MGENTGAQRCSVCGGSKTAGSSGSITQWMSMCTCQEGTEDQQDSVTVCEKCGKRLQKARPGSITQWVFRSDRCNCDNPQPTERKAPKPIGRRIKKSFRALHMEEELFPLDRYIPESVLGKGASGAVYLCFDSLLSTRVSIKVLRTLEKSQLLGFQNEAKAISRLDHPNIVKILDFGATADGIPYMVLEYFQGVSLHERIKKTGPLSVDEVVDLFSAVTEALSHAHQRGVLHRDIKSSNLLVSAESQNMDVRILDFGVASFKYSSQPPSTKQSATIVGSPRYMAPDTAAGMQYDERSEIYSLGCTIYEALTGETPFAGETPMEILSQHSSAEVPEIGRRDVPPTLVNLVSRCLEKNPKSRFQSMNEVLDSLSSCAASDEKAVSVQSLVPEHRQPRLSTMSVVAILSVLILAGAIGAVFWNNLDTEDQDKTEATSSTYRGQKNTTVLSAMDAFGKPKALTYKRRGRNYLELRGAIRDDDMEYYVGGKDYDHLSLNRAAITDRALQYVRSDVVSLHVGETRITDRGLELISQRMKSLVELSIPGTQISDDGIKYLAGLPNLDWLNVSYNEQLTDRALANLARSKRLRYVNLSYLPMVSARGIHSLSVLARLNQIDIYGMRLSAEVVDALSRCKALRSLSVGYPELRDSDIVLLDRLPLKTLTINPCSLSADGVVSLSRLKKLRHLTLFKSPEVTRRSVDQLQARSTKLKIDVINPSETIRHAVRKQQALMD